MSDDVDVAGRLREIADELEADRLPEFDGNQIEEEIDHGLNGFRVYRDERGAAWVEVTEDEPAWCLGHHVEEFVEAVREADDT